MNERLPDSNHVTRYCKPTTIGEDGWPTGPSFEMRQNDHYLSVNWLEFFGGLTTELAIERVIHALHAKAFQLRPNGRFAIIQIGTTVAHVSEATKGKTTLRFMREPVMPHDPSHSGIHGYGVDETIVAALIAECVSEVHATHGNYSR